VLCPALQKSDDDDEGEASSEGYAPSGEDDDEESDDDDSDDDSDASLDEVGKEFGGRGRREGPGLSSNRVGSGWQW
jgi:hypothetical protein